MAALHGRHNGSYLVGKSSFCGMHADLMKLSRLVMPRCTMHRRHTVVRSCVGPSVPRFLGLSVPRLSDLAYLRER